MNLWLDYRDRVGSPVFTRGPTVRDRHRAAQRGKKNKLQDGVPVPENFDKQSVMKKRIC
jgi:hypothetical protein